MINVKKEVKTNDLLGGGFASAPSMYWANIRNMTKTSNILCGILYSYFSTETGRQRQRKEFSISNLRSLLGNKDKIASRGAVEQAINEVKELGLFLINESFFGKEKMITFYISNEKNKEIFEDVNKKIGYFQGDFSENYYKNNIIKIENHLQNFDTHSQKNVSHSQKNVNELQKNVNVENPETLINTSFNKSLKSRQDYYIKDYNIKDYFSKDNFTQSNFDKELEKETKKTNKETSILDYSFSKLANQENKKTDNSEKEKVINDLKNFGITSNIESLFKFNSIAEIKKQLEYHSYRENKSAGILYNAIKNKESAPAEYLNYLEIKKNDAYLLSGFYKLQCDMGAGIERTFKYNQKNLVTTLLYKLNNFGHLETNNPIENTENRFKQSDRMYLDTLINPLLKLFSKYKVSELMEHIKQGKETLFNTISLRREEIAVKELFTKKGIDLFKIEKSLNKINSMQSYEVI
jgi:hypothetical protein